MAVNAVIVFTFKSFMIFPSVRYAGLKLSPHSETQWASSIAMCFIPVAASFSTSSGFCKTSGFARIIFGAVDFILLSGDFHFSSNLKFSSLSVEF